MTRWYVRDWTQYEAVADAPASVSALREGLEKCVSGTLETVYVINNEERESESHSLKVPELFLFALPFSGFSPDFSKSIPASAQQICGFSPGIIEEVHGR